jgi:hypothetical protein
MGLRDAMTTLTWRAFDGERGDTITVTTYETPLGRTCDAEHSRVVRVERVSAERAVAMLRANPSDF